MPDLHKGMASSTHSIDYVRSLYGTPSPFPPSFEGNPFSYAFGLFGDVVCAAIALTILLSFVLEGRRFRTVAKRLGHHIHYHVGPPWTPLWLYRAGQQFFLLFVVMRTLPDAIWMLAWGEVEVQTIEAMLRFDLICDGLAVIPLFIASLAWARGRQVIQQKLVEGLHVTVSGGPPWDMLLKNARIIGVVLFISLLVTIGKASG